MTQLSAGSVSDFEPTDSSFGWFKRKLVRICVLEPASSVLAGSRESWSLSVFWNQLTQFSAGSRESWSVFVFLNQPTHLSVGARESWSVSVFLNQLTQLSFRSRESWSLYVFLNQLAPVSYTHLTLPTN